MAQPFPLQSSFGGMMQDWPRDGLPGSALWNVVDFIPQTLGSPLRKRGGWSYASRALGTSTYIDGLCFAPFITGEKNVAVGQDGNVYSYTAGAETSYGAAFAIAQNPVYHRASTPSGGAVVIPAASGTTLPIWFNGASINSITTAPKAIYAAVWNDRVLLANGTDFAGPTLMPNRLWFGPIGDDTGTWAVTTAWQDGSQPITGLGVLKSTIFMFHTKTTERLRGTTPPSSTGIGDLVQDLAFQVGCIDARSIVNYNDTLLWADVRGVYQTDGAALKDLTASGGMRSYWRSMLASYTSSYKVAAGVYNDLYIVSVMNGTTFVDCLAYDLTHSFWFRMANFPGRAFTSTGSTFEECYMALGNAGRVASLSSILTPTAAVKNDANGTAVAPYLETGMYRGFMHVHRRWLPSLALQDWRNLFFNYDLRDAAADIPTITISYATDPGATSYTALARTLPATTKYTRSRRDLGFNANGLMLKVAQTNASSDTRMSGFEAEYSAREASRLAQ